MLFGCCAITSSPILILETFSPSGQQGTDEVEEQYPACAVGQTTVIEEGQDQEDTSLVIADQWRLLEPLSYGSITTVQLAVNRETNEGAVVRTEDKDSELGGLAREACLLRKFNSKCGKVGFPIFHHFSLEGPRHILITQLLGPSLERKFNDCGRRFCQKTVSMIAVQMLYRLEYLHNMKVVHRAIHPGSIRVGNGADHETLYLTDLTQAKTYRSGEQHIPYRENARRSENVRFSSTADHVGAEKSRRDDLESLALTLAYFMRSGNLPWQHLEDEPPSKERDEKLLEAKRSAKVEELALGLRPLEELILYCRSLWFEANPNYTLLRKSFRKALPTEDAEGSGMFCWSPHQCPQPITKMLSRVSECSCSDRNSTSTGEPTCSATLSMRWSLLTSRSRGEVNKGM